MKDNYEWESDPGFEEEAWGKMLKLLDKELPVERKRRRGGLWLFPLLLLIGISIGGATMWYYLNSQTPTLGHLPIDMTGKKLNTLTHKKIATKKELTKTNNTSNSLTSTTTTTNSNATSRHIETTKTTSASIFNKKTAITDRQKSIKNTIILPTSTKSPAIPTSSLVVDSLIQAILEPIQTKSTKNAVSIALDPAIDKALGIPERLSNQDMALLSLPNRFINFPSITSSKTQRSLCWGLVTGITANQNIKWQGFFAGVQTSYQFKPRWSINSGIQYAQQSIYDLNYEIVVPPIVTIDSEIEDDDDIETTSDPSSDGTGFAETEAVIQDTSFYSIIPQEKHGFIELPLNVDYHFVSRWTITLGAQLTYRLGEINTRFQDATISGQVSTDFPLDIDNSSYDYNALMVSEPKLQKWQVQPTISLSWKANYNLRFLLQYKINKNWTKVNTQSAKATEFNNQTSRAIEKESALTPLEHNFRLGVHFLF